MLCETKFSRTFRPMYQFTPYGAVIKTVGSFRSSHPSAHGSNDFTSRPSRGYIESLWSTCALGQKIPRRRTDFLDSVLSSNIPRRFAFVGSRSWKQQRLFFPESSGRLEPYRLPLRSVRSHCPTLMLSGYVSISFGVFRRAISKSG